MRCLVLFVLLVAANTLPAIYQFNSWKQTHGKVYQAKEELERMAIFMDNLKFIEEYNAREDTNMTLGLNVYADLSHEEFKAMLTGSVNQTKEHKAWLDKEASSFIPPANFEAPSKVDWRTKGAVTPVKNQGGCGSCYSFSTTGGVEGQWFRKTGSLVSLSEQQIIDCSSNYGNNGCDGGLMTSSFNYIKYNGGIDTEQGYPYEAAVSYCRYQSAYVGAKVKNFAKVAASETSLKTAVASVGPISVAIDAAHRSFQFYTGGVYYEPECSSHSLDHAVLAVGYGTSGGQDYWIVKNSWGTSWGISGYFWLLRNYYNHCGIASMASYPLV